jgi:phage/plasmid-like protein (TIGR03299 family)
MLFLLAQMTLIERCPLAYRKEKTMAHALEQDEQGNTAFALRGEPAWHKLGQVFDKEQHITTAEMLEMAHLNDWNVRLEELSVPEGYRSTTKQQMVIRTNPFDKGTDVLAIVGNRYNVVQNETLFDFGDALLDGGADWESAGSIKNGKVVFGSLTVPKEFILDPQGANDKTVSYLLVHTSHDGSTAVQANITPVRVVCQNTLNMALNGSKQSFKIRHSNTVDGKIALARETLGLTFAHMDNFEIMANSLFAKALNDVEFDKLVKGIYPEPEIGSAKSALTVWNDKIDTIYDLYQNGATNANITGTAWGALNALTERIDYYRTGRKGGEAIVAAASGFDPVVNAEKARILSATLALV